MKELVFFLQGPIALTDTRILLVQLASYIAETTNVRTYYVNPTYPEYDGMQLSEKLHIRTADEFDYDKHNDATFVTVTNRLFFLLAKIAPCKNAKVLLLHNYNEANKALVNQMATDNRDTGSILKMLCDNAACLFLNGNTAVEALKYYGTEDPIPYLHEVNGFAAAPAFEASARIPGEEIHIGWYGAYGERTANPLRSLLSNLNRTHPGKKFCVHLIGDARQKWTLDFSWYPNIKRFLINKMDSEQAELEYLKTNVDMVFSYGTHAIKAAALGLPTVVVPVTDKAYKDNQYVFFHETENGVITWTPDDLWSKHMCAHTLYDIIRKLCEDGGKEQLGELCYRHYLANHSLSAGAEALLAAAENSRVTVGKCMENAGISTHMTNYFQALEKNPKLDYQQYYQKLHKRPATAPAAVPPPAAPQKSGILSKSKNVVKRAVGKLTK